jgi:hypothetical protein
VPFNNDQGIVWNDLAYPGLKTYEMGLAIIDRWLKAGHPGAGPLGDVEDKQRALFLAIASPVKRDRPTYWSVEVTERRKNWYFHALRSEALKKRLLAEMLARKDDTFTETAFANIISFSRTSATYRKDRRDERADFLFFWRGLEVDRRQWKVATRLIAENAYSGGDLYDESVHLWRRYPWARGHLLFLLAMAVQNNRDLAPWPEFGRVFGGAVSAKEAGEFLAIGCRAVAALPEVWPALGMGWSRSEILIPHLDRFIEDAHMCANDFQAPRSTLTEVVRNLRAEKADADLRRLHAYFKKRIALHPSEERNFETLLDLTQ